MTTSSAPRPRRSVLRALALAALVGGLTPVGPSSALATEPETFTLTIRHLDRTGLPATEYGTQVLGLAGEGADKAVHPYDASGTATVRLPRGRYMLNSALTDRREGISTDWIVQPRLDLDRDTTVTVDARTTAPVDVRPPDPAAVFRRSGMFVEVSHGGASREVNIVNATPSLRVAHLGPDAEPGSVRQWFDAYWSNDTAQYALGQTFTGSRALTGLTRRYAQKDLATLRLRAGARPGTTGTARYDLQPKGDTTVSAYGQLTAPGTTTFHVTPDRGTWNMTYTAPTAPEGTPNRYVADITARAGATTTHTFDNPVFGPSLAGRPGAERDGGKLLMDVPMLADGDGHAPSSPSYDTAFTTLTRDGVRIGTHSGTPGRAEFTVPPSRAAYRLTSTVSRRSAAGATTRATASWTFTSEAPTAKTPGKTALKTPGNTPLNTSSDTPLKTTGSSTPTKSPLPLSTVRFSPPLDATGTATADTPVRVPVTVEGAAANGRVRSLRVSVSTDGGASWTRLPVEDGAVTIHNPRAGTGVSLRAELTDTAGNTLEQTLVDAYRTE
ncbi:serine protease [Streptomyces fradiae]|uniref:serine protease n=1 Tax=Streptomyces fradiae TaxID=1906 RepID=UPI00366917AA